MRTGGGWGEGRGGRGGRGGHQACAGVAVQVATRRPEARPSPQPRRRRHRGEQCTPAEGGAHAARKVGGNARPSVCSEPVREAGAPPSCPTVCRTSPRCREGSEAQGLHFARAHRPSGWARWGGDGGSLLRASPALRRAPERPAATHLPSKAGATISPDVHPTGSRAAPSSPRRVPRTTLQLCAARCCLSWRRPPSPPRTKRRCSPALIRPRLKPVSIAYSRRSSRRRNKGRGRRGARASSKG